MALTRATYTQAPGQFMDKAVTPATVADGTLFQRFDIRAFPQKGVKYTGTIGHTTGGGAVVVARQTTGTVSVAEVDTVTITNSPASGTFKLTFGGNDTTALARNASAAAVATALNALAGVTVTVTGAAGGPYTITWTASGVRALFTSSNTFPIPGSPVPAPAHTTTE